MTIYLVRHGKDDDSVRGGWNSSPLTSEGIAQVKELASRLVKSPGMNIGQIFTSDLPRARQTADILSDELALPVVEMPEFRETNNGVLAGMDNDAATERFPGLYWSALEWEEHYPDGESPREFFDRISSAWHGFKKKLQMLDYDVILVTHGGVINAIRCIENGVTYSNKSNPYSIGNAEMISVTFGTGDIPLV